MTKKSFGAIKSTDELTVQEGQQRIMSLRADDDYEKRILAEPISIMRILPDPQQPRRVIPSIVRAAMQQSASPLDEWAIRAYCETTGTKHKTLNLHTSAALETVTELYRKIIKGSDDVQRPAQPGPIEAALLKVADLAATIRRDGLLNPISVFKDADGYQIETGERRWLAYHLLDHYGFAGYDKIPARVFPEFSAFRQAAENNQRDDLNAIGKARQFALLLMALLEQDGIEFQPMFSFDQEQNFYAQVADAEQHRIPYGKSGDLLNAMGVKDRSSLSLYRRLLSLPNKYWVEGDDENAAINDLASLVPIVESFNNSSPQPAPAAPAPHIPNNPNTPTNPTPPLTAGGYEEGRSEPGIVRNRPQPRWPSVGDMVTVASRGVTGRVTRIVGDSQVQIRVGSNYLVHLIGELQPASEDDLNPQPVQQPVQRPPLVQSWTNDIDDHETDGATVVPGRYVDGNGVIYDIDPDNLFASIENLYRYLTADEVPDFFSEDVEIFEQFSQALYSKMNGQAD